MSQLPPEPEYASSARDSTPMITLAQETHTSVDVVKALYDEEVAALQATATVKAFIGVIATRRVKRHLKGLRAKRSDLLACSNAALPETRRPPVRH